MLNSGIRKKALSGWLKKHYDTEFSSSLKLQKYLFFYETISKIENDVSDFSHLRGYSNGPVFSEVYGDYTYRKNEFYFAVEEDIERWPEFVNEERAKFAGFLVSILNEKDLSEITHELNIWKSREEDITHGLKNVSLDPEDLNEDDRDILFELRRMYPAEYIDSVRVITVGQKNFVIRKDEVQKLSDEAQRVFISLADEESLQNPVYVSVSDEGVVLVD